MVDNTLRPYGWQHRTLNLDQRPVKDEAETSTDGTFGSDLQVPDEDSPVVTAAMSDEEYKKRYGHPRGQKPHTHAHETGGPDYAWESQKPGGPGTHSHGGNQRLGGKYAHKHEPPQKIGDPSRYDPNARPQRNETPQDRYHGKPKTSDVRRRSLEGKKPDSTGNRYDVSGRQAGEANTSPWGRGSSVQEPDFTGVQHPDRGRIQYPYDPDTGKQVEATPDTAGTDAPGGNRSYGPGMAGETYSRNYGEDTAGRSGRFGDRALERHPMWRENKPLGAKPSNRSQQSHPVFDRPIDRAMIREAIESELAKSEISLHRDASGSTEHHSKGGFSGQDLFGGGRRHRHEGESEFHAHQMKHGPTEVAYPEPSGGMQKRPDDPGGPARGEAYASNEEEGYPEGFFPDPAEQEQYQRGGKNFGYGPAGDEDSGSALEEDSVKPTGARPGQPAEHFHISRPGQARKALNLAQSVVQKYTTGPSAIALGQPSDQISPEKAKKILSDDSAQGHPLTEKQKGMFGAAAGRADKAAPPVRPATPGFSLKPPSEGPSSPVGGQTKKEAPNVFREGSRYAPPSPAGAPKPAMPGASFGRPKTPSPVGQSMGGRRAGQPSGSMQPKRPNAAY